MICGKFRLPGVLSVIVAVNSLSIPISGGTVGENHPQAHCEEIQDRSHHPVEKAALGSKTPIYGGMSGIRPWLESGFLPKKDLFSTEKCKLSTVRVV